MRPPFTLTNKILNYATDISRLLGQFEGLHAPIPQPKLRKQNQIKTVQGSLAIEGNTLNLVQVTAILNNKRVLGPKKDVLEVKNTIQLYELLLTFNPTSKKDLLKAHSVLMNGLAPDAGKFRNAAVGILKGKKISHIAPPFVRIPGLIEDLLEFLKKEKELSPLITACIFHYEFEFIHPFMDGNGRMGRFWQHLILSKFHDAFIYAPVESLIKERQIQYNEVLEKSDRAGESTAFIEFSLEALRDTLQSLINEILPAKETPESRLRKAQDKFCGQEFSRKDYQQFFKTLSSSTASRDLALGVSCTLLQMMGDKALARYRFKTAPSR